MVLLIGCIAHDLYMPRSKDEIFLHKLGLRIRALREERRWTLEETEEHGWPNWRHLQRIETGKNLTVLTARQLSRLNGISLAELFKEI